MYTAVQLLAYLFILFLIWGGDYEDVLLQLEDIRNIHF